MLHPDQFQVEISVAGVALGQDILRVLLLPAVSIIPPLLPTHTLIIYNQRYMTLRTDTN
jgi:hypothetical protein